MTSLQSKRIRPTQLPNGAAPQDERFAPEAPEPPPASRAAAEPALDRRASDEGDLRVGRGPSLQSARSLATPDSAAPASAAGPPSQSPWVKAVAPRKLFEDAPPLATPPRAAPLTREAHAPPSPSPSAPASAEEALAAADAEALLGQLSDRAALDVAAAEAAAGLLEAQRGGGGEAVAQLELLLRLLAARPARTPPDPLLAALAPRLAALLRAAPAPRSPRGPPHRAPRSLGLYSLPALEPGAGREAGRGGQGPGAAREATNRERLRDALMSESGPLLAAHAGPAAAPGRPRTRPRSRGGRARRPPCRPPPADAAQTSATRSSPASPTPAASEPSPTASPPPALPGPAPAAPPVSLPRAPRPPAGRGRGLPAALPPEARPPRAPPLCTRGLRGRQACDSHRLTVHAVAALAAALEELDPAARPGPAAPAPPEGQRDFPDRALLLRVLAAALGAVLAAPTSTPRAPSPRTTGPPPPPPPRPSAPRPRRAGRRPRALPVDVCGAVQRAAARGSLLLTIPWATELLAPLLAAPAARSVRPPGPAPASSAAQGRGGCAGGGRAVLAARRLGRLADPAESAFGPASVACGALVDAWAARLALAPANAPPPEEPLAPGPPPPDSVDARAALVSPRFARHCCPPLHRLRSAAAALARRRRAVPGLGLSLDSPGRGAGLPAGSGGPQRKIRPVQPTPGEDLGWGRPGRALLQEAFLAQRPALHRLLQFVLDAAVPSAVAWAAAEACGPRLAGPLEALRQLAASCPPGATSRPPLRRPQPPQSPVLRRRPRRLPSARPASAPASPSAREQRAAVEAAVALAQEHAAAATRRPAADAARAAVRAALTDRIAKARLRTPRAAPRLTPGPAPQGGDPGATGAELEPPVVAAGSGLRPPGELPAAGEASQQPAVHSPGARGWLPRMRSALEAAGRAAQGAAPLDAGAAAAAGGAIAEAGVALALTGEGPGDATAALAAAASASGLASSAGAPFVRRVLQLAPGAGPHGAAALAHLLWAACGAGAASPLAVEEELLAALEAGPSPPLEALTRTLLEIAPQPATNVPAPPLLPRLQGALRARRPLS
eukprot:tig00001668_g9549.t1